MGHRLGVDVGGTFTDFTLFDEASGTIVGYKSPTVRDDPAQVLVHAHSLVPDSGGPGQWQSGAATQLDLESQTVRRELYTSLVGDGSQIPTLNDGDRAWTPIGAGGATGR